MNDKPLINQKMQAFSSWDADAWRHLQHPRTLIGLSRRRLTSEDVLRLIDTRQIRWAWDIARPDARRPEIRIWRQSLLDYLATETGAPPPEDGSGLADVVRAVLPEPAGFIPRCTTLRAEELGRRLFCSRRHVNCLIEDGELFCDGGFSTSRNLNVSYLSATEFLKRRSLSA